MKKQMYFILLAVILIFCFRGQFAYAEETPLQVEDNWLTREVARQVGKGDLNRLTHENFEKITKIFISDIKSFHTINNIPKEIGLLSNLKELNLSWQNISKLPKELFTLKNLERLYLFENEIEEVPIDLFKLDKLTLLDLDNNQISEIPKEISQLTNLVSLSLSDNKLENFPEGILELLNLFSLDLADNNIDTIPDNISNLNKLAWLLLQNNNIKDIKSLSKLESLDTLNLIGNSIEELSLENGFSKLSSLSLGNNNIKTLIFPQTKSPNITALTLENNKIAEIPESITNLTNLEILNLDNNKISKIPKSMNTLKKLVWFYINNNKIYHIPFITKPSNTGGTTSVSGQTITLSQKKVSNNSTIRIKNIVSLVDTNVIPKEISTGGIYDKKNNEIVWDIKNLSKNNYNLSYSFSYTKYGLDENCIFSGTVIQPIEIEGTLTAINLKKSEITLQVGKSTLNSVIYNPIDTTDDKTVIWTSSNKNIATVTSKGKITGVSSGSAIITAKVGTLKATCKVTVKDDNKPTDNKIYFTDDYEGKTVTKNETIRIPVKLSTIKDYYALDSSIKYDKTKLEFTGYSIKDNYKDCYADSSDVDTLRFILASKGKKYPIKTSDDPIIYLNFKCIATGDANVTITSTTLANLNEEVTIKADNLNKTTIHITGTTKPTDINRDGKFSLIDLAIDAYYYGVDANETDNTKYDADIIPDGKIDDLDLMEITKNIINNK